jgi:hypothetical protein
LIDAGPLGAGSGGHGHADALSICVSDTNGPALIDSGTFEYVGDGQERNRYRGTSAHNTLTIDGVSQPEPRGPFAWSHHPKSVPEKWINGERFDFFAGNHDAYQRLRAPVIHRRQVFSLKSGFWIVRDVIQGAGEHQLDSYWHLAPEYASSDGGRFVRKSGGVFDVITPGRNNWSRRVEAVSWSPVYGQSQAAPVLHFSTVASLPVESVTLFRSAENAGARLRKLAVVGQTSSVSGYAYAEDDEEHWMFFATAGEHWTLDEWTSDAQFVYWGYDRKQDRGTLICCGGSKVSFAGHEIVATSQPFSFCEVVRENGTVRVLGPQKEAIIVRDPGLRTLVEPIAAVNAARVVGPARS